MGNEFSKCLGHCRLPVASHSLDQWGYGIYMYMDSFIVRRITVFYCLPRRRATRYGIKTLVQEQGIIQINNSNNLRNRYTAIRGVYSHEKGVIGYLVPWDFRIKLNGDV
jgi:hypothetical protein